MLAVVASNADFDCHVLILPVVYRLARRTIPLGSGLVGSRYDIGMGCRYSDCQLDFRASFELVLLVDDGGQRDLYLFEHAGQSV